MAETARLRHAVWRQVDPEAYERQGLSPTNQAVVWIVALSSILAILETEPAVENMAPRVFSQLEWIFALVFFLEYLVRLWAEGESPRFRGVQGRIRYALTPSAIVDLIAFLPSLVLPLLPGTSNFMLLRVFRLRPYPSASGSPKCCSGEGGSLIERIRNITSVRGRYDRLSSLLDRVPTAFQ